MVSVETKTFENGVMRMVGISTYDCISVIFYQSAVFVVPSMLLAYILAVLINYIIYNALFSSDMGI